MLSHPGWSRLLEVRGSRKVLPGRAADVRPIYEQSAVKNHNYQKSSTIEPVREAGEFAGGLPMIVRSQSTLGIATQAIHRRRP
jgi:hypothetical protein